MTRRRRTLLAAAGAVVVLAGGVTAVGVSQRHPANVVVRTLPDPRLTPGAVNPAVTQANISQTICVAGWTATVRPATSVTDRIKVERMAAYGYGSMRLSDFELDHLVALELGGAPADVANLWPEPWVGAHNAHDKDAAENRLHRAVCAGTESLVDAQHAIVTNWETA